MTLPSRSVSVAARSALRGSQRFVLAVAISLAGASTLLAQVDERPGIVTPTSPRNTVGVEYEYERFESELDPWHSLSFELGHKFDRVSIIGRVNRARRFNQDGSQFEIEAYPKLWSRAYMYASVAASSDTIFPDRRYGMQIYQGLGNGFEVSAGARLLDFDGNRTRLYTGSIGRYFGNYYVTLSPYVADSDSRKDLSASLQAALKYYFTDADNNIGFRAGYGRVPETDVLLEQNLELENWSVRVDRQFPVGGLLARVAVGFRDQELTFNRKRQSFLAGLALRKRF